MAENNRDTEHFALGLIVAAIIYFVFRKQLDKALGISGGNSRGGNGGSGSVTTMPSKSANCGCGGGSDLPENPGVSLGGQSYQSPTGAFEAASVTPAIRGAFPSISRRTSTSATFG